MKKNQNNTNDRYVFEIILAILLIISLIIFGFNIKERTLRIKSEPTSTDLIQQQEMIDYAKSEGRTINVY